MSFEGKAVDPSEGVSDASCNFGLRDPAAAAAQSRARRSPIVDLRRTFDPLLREPRSRLGITPPPHSPSEPTSLGFPVPSDLNQLRPTSPIFFFCSSLSRHQPLWEYNRPGRKDAQLRGPGGGLREHELRSVIDVVFRSQDGFMRLETFITKACASPLWSSSPRKAAAEDSLLVLLH